MVVGTKKVASSSVKKSSVKTSQKKVRDEGISEADLQYLEERRKVGKRKKQVVRTEQAPVPVSNHLSGIFLHLGLLRSKVPILRWSLRRPQERERLLVMSSRGELRSNPPNNPNGGSPSVKSGDNKCRQH